MIGLYVHVPFCIKKCYYCDFNSFPYHEEQVQSYLRGIKKEAELYQDILGPDQQILSSIFIGGGTPTCMEGPELKALLDLCQQAFVWNEGLEFTVETNPGTLTPEKLQILKAGGVTRLSMGVQAFQDDLLGSIGRIHKTEDVYRSVEMIRQAGFTNLNLDLIFGLPRQTIKDWRESLEKAVDLKPEHLAVYSLKIEEGTPFGSQKEQGSLEPMEEELELTMYQEAIAYLKRAGYEHYEISNFAKPGFQSKHNLIYWNNGEYLGLGPGAWSYLDHQRFANHKGLTDYQKVLDQNKLPVSENEQQTKPIEMSETVFMALRKIEGLDLKLFSERFGVRVQDIFAKPIEKLIKLKMLEIVNNKLRLTPKGLPIANEIFTHFLL